MAVVGRLVGTKKRGIVPKLPKPKLPPNIQAQFGSLFPNSLASPSKVGTVTPRASSVGAAAQPLQAQQQAAKPVSPIPGNPPAPGTPDPRDAEYYNLLATNEFTRNQGIQSLTRQKGESQSAFDTLLQRLIPQEQESNQNTKQVANKEGLFYSGILGKRLQDVATGFENQRTDARTNLSSALAGFGEQERGLYGQYGTGANGDYGLQGAGLLNAATGRQGERDRIAADIAAQNAAAAELAKLLAGQAAQAQLGAAGSSPVVIGSKPQVNAAAEKAKAAAAANQAVQAAKAAEAAAKAAKKKKP